MIQIMKHMKKKKIINITIMPYTATDKEKGCSINENYNTPIKLQLQL